MRIETVINCPRDLACNARLPQPGRTAGQGPGGQRPYPECRARRPGPPSLRVQPSSGSRTRPSPRTGGGPPAPRSRRSSGHGPWPAPLCSTLLAATGITNKSLRALMTGLLAAPCTGGQMTYDLPAASAWPGSSTGSITPNRYVLTPDGNPASPSSTPNCTTACSAPSWPPASHRHPPSSAQAPARHRPATSTTTSPHDATRQKAA